MDVTPRVRSQIEPAFTPELAARVLADLEAVEFPLIANNGERVQLALIFLSQGDYGTFQQELAIARRDWRDTLVAAGM